MAARILIVFLGFALLVAFEWARGSVTGAGRAAKEGGAAALPPIQPSELIVEVAAATGQMKVLKVEKNQIFGTARKQFMLF